MSHACNQLADAVARHPHLAHLRLLLNFTHADRLLDRGWRPGLEARVSPVVVEFVGLKDEAAAVLAATRIASADPGGGVRLVSFWSHINAPMNIMTPAAVQALTHAAERGAPIGYIDVGYCNNPSTVILSKMLMRSGYGQLANGDALFFTREMADGILEAAQRAADAPVAHSTTDTSV